MLLQIPLSGTSQLCWPVEHSSMSAERQSETYERNGNKKRKKTPEWVPMSHRAQQQEQETALAPVSSKKSWVFSRQLQHFIMNNYGNLRKGRSQDFDKTLVLPVWHLSPINPDGHTQTCLFFVWLYAQSPVWQGDGRPHFDEFPDQKDVFRKCFRLFRPWSH